MGNEMRPRSTTLSNFRGSTLETEMSSFTAMKVVEPPIFISGSTDAQKRELNRLYLIRCRKASGAVLKVLENALGAVEALDGFRNCVVADVFYFDFGTEKIRFVCETGSARGERS